MRVGLLSPCGHGNLGDAAIQEAVMVQLRKRLPGVEFVGITMRPSDTRSRHGIQAVPIAAHSTPGYSVEADESGTAPGSGAPRPAPMQARRSLAQPFVEAGAWLARRLLPRGLPWLIRCELRHLRQAQRLLKNLDLLLVSGGGQLDQFWGGPWGHPYALAKWTVLARLCGRPVMILSVGFGTLSSPASRTFARIALRMARYRSYRDAGSRRLMHEAGFRRDDPVVPDLAFGLESAAIAAAAPQPASAAAGRIAISPIAYRDPVLWPEKDAAIYRTYLERLTALCVELLNAGKELTLIASDGPDHRTVVDLADAIRRFAPAAAAERVHIPGVQSVEEFIGTVLASDALVASRLHGLLLSQLALTPVLALSYDRKVIDLMAALGQSRYCLEIENFDPAECSRLLAEIDDRRQPIRASLAARVADFKRAVESQFDLVANAWT